MVALAVALFLGIGAGYYVRYLHAHSKKNSIELDLKEKEIDAEKKALAIIEEAENKAERIEAEAKAERKHLEEKLEQKETRLSKREEILDDRQIDIDSQKESLQDKVEQIKSIKAQLDTRVDEADKKLEAVAGLTKDEAVEKLMALAHVRIAPPVRNTEDAEFAVMCLAEEFARLEARRGAEAEIEEAMEDLTGLADEGLTWRLSRAAEARHRAERSKLDEISEQGEDRAALSAELQRLIDGAAWIKKKP